MKNNFLRLVAIASVVLVTLFAFSCKSSEATEEPVAAQASEVQVSEPVESVLVATDTSDWTENVFADANQHGYFFTTSEIGQFSMVEVATKTDSTGSET